MCGAGVRRGADRSWLVAHGEEKIPKDAAARANELVARRAKGEPLAYLLGYREFYGRKFQVSPEVLIPRPETEGLIELVRELVLSKEAQKGGMRKSSVNRERTEARILEVGTGSGCIAVTLALEMPRATVVATDVSEAALGVARANSKALGAKVAFLRGDLLKTAPRRPQERLEGGGKSGAGWEQGTEAKGQERTENGLLEQNYDILVANLPYVDENWEWLDKRTLDFEPGLALYAGDGGLALYKELIRQIRGRNEGLRARNRGERFVRYVVLEVDPCQHEELVRFAEKNGLTLMKAEGFGLVFVSI